MVMFVTDLFFAGDEKAGELMDIVVGFIIGAFVGSIITAFTMSLFLVNGRHR